MAYAYKASITIDHTKCGTADSTDFPVLIAGTYDGTGGEPDLRVAGSGGKVQHASGYDIAFFSDSGLTTALKFERVFWTSTTGACQFYVKVPTLDVSDDVVIYMGYGDSGISVDQQDADNTWETNFKYVGHFQGNSNDSSGNGLNGTDRNATYGTDYGKYGQGVNFNGSSTSYINLGNSALLNPTALSIICWVNVDDLTAVYVQYQRGTADSNVQTFQVRNGGKLGTFLECASGLVYDYTSGTAITATTWYRVAFTYSAAAGLINYRNGAQDATASQLGNLDVNAGIEAFIGLDQYNARGFNGSIDEFFHYTGVLSPSWITADYNNQSSPSTFYAMGDETAVGGARGFITSNSKFW